MSTPTHKWKVLVTGGTGFIGAYVIRELVHTGYSVRAIRRSPTLPRYINQQIFDQVEWFDSDLFDIVGLTEAMEGCDAVIHCAAKVSFAEKDRSEIFRTNVNGTANMVDAALEARIGRFIHLSSVAAIGRSREAVTVDESTKWQQNKMQTSYSISKYKAEMEVWRGIAEGLNAVIVNPSIVLGYGDWHSSSSAIFKNVFEQFPWYTNGINGFVDVEDVARAIVLLLKVPVKGERFILNGDNWSYRNLFNAIADGFGKKRPHREATPLLAGIAWRVSALWSRLSGKPSMLTRETARIAQSETRFSNHKILKALPGFSFTPLGETIENACRRYLSSR